MYAGSSWNRTLVEILLVNIIIGCIPLSFMSFILKVVDVISTWRRLGPELSCDSRPLMVKVIAELLALVPQLTVKSEEYEVSGLLH